MPVAMTFVTGQLSAVSRQPSAISRQALGPEAGSQRPRLLRSLEFRLEGSEVGDDDPAAVHLDEIFRLETAQVAGD
jgi:hypothetical protein